MARRIRAKLLIQATPIIDDIAERNRTSAAFAYFTGKDIGQEVWVICLNALREYRPTKGQLEHYLRRCVANRLKNLRRDRYFRRATDDLDLNGEVQTRINLVNALPFGDGDIAEDGRPVTGLPPQQPCDLLMAEELQRSIESRLPSAFKTDFSRLVKGARVPQPRLDQVRAAVREILEEING